MDNNSTQIGEAGATNLLPYYLIGGIAAFAIMGYMALTSGDKKPAFDPSETADRLLEEEEAKNPKMDDTEIVTSSPMSKSARRRKNKKEKETQAKEASIKKEQEEAAKRGKIFHFSHKLRGFSYLTLL